MFGDERSSHPSRLTGWLDSSDSVSPETTPLSTTRIKNRYRPRERNSNKHCFNYAHDSIMSADKNKANTVEKASEEFDIPNEVFWQRVNMCAAAMLPPRFGSNFVLYVLNVDQTWPERQSKSEIALLGFLSKKWIIWASDVKIPRITEPWHHVSLWKGPGVYQLGTACNWKPERRAVNNSFKYRHDI